MSILASTEFTGFFINIHDIHSNIFIDIALLLIIGIIGGKLAEMIHLPRVTGYIIIGIVFGNILKLLNPELLDEVISDFKSLKILGLGFIGYNIGLEINLNMQKYMRNEVIFVTIFQSLFTFTLVAGAILLFVDNDYVWTYALIFGAIASVTTPAPIVACIKSYHTRGKLTTLLCPMIALDDVLGVILFAFVLPVSVYLAGHQGQDIGFLTLVANPFTQILFSVGVGLLIGYVIFRMLNYFYKGDNITIFLIVFIGLLFGIGLTYMTDTSTILLPLTIGAFLANKLSFELRDKVRTLSDAVILPILLVFFTISGAGLDLALLGSLGIMGLIYVAVRVIGKIIGASAATTIIREEDKVKKYLGFALIPQGGVAIDMAILAEIRFMQIYEQTGELIYKDIGYTIFAIIIGAVLIYKIFGEIIVKWTFKQANEITYEDHEAHAHLI